MLEKTLESPLHSQEIKPVNSNGINPKYSLEGLILKLKLQYFWPHDVKNGLIRKDPEAGKDGGQEEKRVTEDEMVGWHHRFNGLELEQTQGDSEGQPFVLQSMGSQRVRHDRETEQDKASS